MSYYILGKHSDTQVYIGNNKCLLKAIAWSDKVYKYLVSELDIESSVVSAVVVKNSINDAVVMAIPNVTSTNLTKVLNVLSVGGSVSLGISIGINSIYQVLNTNPIRSGVSFGIGFNGGMNVAGQTHLQTSINNMIQLSSIADVEQAIAYETNIAMQSQLDMVLKLKKQAYLSDYNNKKLSEINDETLSEMTFIII